MEQIHIREYVTAAGSKPRVDREKGILFDVKFLGEESSNPYPINNTYPRATREKAIAVLEGSRININHPPKGEENQTRDYGASFGVAKNLRETGSGIFGECHFNPKHHLAEQVCWDAENCPENLGFSICAHGRGARDSKTSKFVIESIDSRQSIDLVSRPATTKGLFESEHQPMRTIKIIRESLPAECVKGIQFLREMEDMGMAAAPVEVPPESSSEDQIWGAFKSAIMAAIDDDGLDIKATLKRVGEILKAYDKLNVSAASKTETPAEPPAATESARGQADQGLALLQEQLRQTIEEAKVRDLVEDAGIVFAKKEARKIFVKSLLSLTESERAALIEEKKTRSASPGIRSASPQNDTGKPITESQQQQNTPPADPAALARWLQAV